MTRPCKVGVQLPEVERRVAWPELFAMARAVEGVGLDSLWLGDHLLYDLPDGSTRGPWEVWTSLAALAAVTERVELGPLVACTGFHSPAMLAKQAATVDAISGGRLIVALGAGWNEREFRAFGFPFERRVDRFAESLTVIATLLGEGSIDHHGEFFDLDRCVLDPPPVRPGGPPLMIGSVAPRMLSIGLPFADAWNAWWSQYGNSVDGFVSLKRTVDAAIAAAGRPPGNVAATVCVLVQLAGGSGRVMGDFPGRDIRPVTGSPADIAAHLAALARAGAEHVQLVLDPITEASIETVGAVLDILDRT